MKTSLTNQLYRGTKIREAACLAHLRRKIFNVHDAQPTALSTIAMAGIQAIYKIEDEIRGLPPSERLAARKARMRPLVRTLCRELGRLSVGLSRHAEIAKAFNYGTPRWPARTGQPDSRARHPQFTVGRRNWLLSGSLAAAQRSAVILSIIETCKANDVDAEPYMADVMERIQNDWPASRWDELMPWNWSPPTNDVAAIAA